MAKQTLFEAEAVLSINTSAFFTDVDRVAQQAATRLQRALSSLSVPTLRAGGGAGSSGGGGSGSSYADRMFSDNMKYARLERSAGQYGDALSRLNNLMQNYRLNAMQMSQAEDLRDKIMVRQTQNLGRLQRAQDRLDAQRNRTVGGGGTVIGGSDQVVNRMFKDEMASAKAAAAAGNYGEAEARYTAIINNQRISVEQLNRATAQLAALRRRSGINPSGFIGPLQANGLAVSNTGPGRNPTGFIGPPSPFMGNPTGMQGPYMANGNFVSPYGGLSNPRGFIGPLLPNGQQTMNGGGSGRGGGMQMAMMSNASYALQDFITVLSMGGGFQRALLSASNNVGFMAGMLGTTSGAIIGVGAVLASVFIPKLLSLARGMEDASVIAERFKDRIKQLGEEMQAAGGRRKTGFDIEDLTKASSDARGAGNPATARKIFEDAIKATSRERDIERSQLSEGEANAKEARARTMEDFYKNTLGRDPGRGGGKLFAEERKWVADVISGKITPEEIRNGNTPAKWGAGTQKDWNAFAESIRDINDPLDKSKKSIEALTERLQEMKKAAEEAARHPERHDPNNPDNWQPMFPNVPGGAGQHPAPPPGFRGGAFDPMTGGDWSSARKQGIEGFLHEFAPKEAEIAKVREQFSELINANPEETAGLKALRDAKIAKIKARSDSSLHGEMGVADFASQLTNQLLRSDPQKELVELAKKQGGLIERLVGKDNALYIELETLNKKSFGPFVP